MQEFADKVNKDFIPIKIDKEELPDVDAFYMGFLVDTQGGGGWPLNVFLTPHLVPLLACTYRPVDQLVNKMNHAKLAYKTDPQLPKERIENTFTLSAIPEQEAKENLKNPRIEFGSVDSPRFPNPGLVLYALKKGHEEALEQFENLMTKSLFDHIEGGWFRYTVDGEWRIPHFEKMLYDQATLLYLCAEMHTHKPTLAEYAIKKTLSWLERMKLPSGLYGSATDADTAEGEGYYYSFPMTSDDQVKALFKTTECGWHEGRLVPWVDFEWYEKNKEKAESIMKTMAEVRKGLDQPKLDTKSVMAWNCFLAYALTKCGEALKDKTITDKGYALFEAIRKLHTEDGFHHVVYGEEPLDSHEYLVDFAAYLLLISELQKAHPELKKEFTHTLKAIKEKFLQPFANTTEKMFDSIYLCEDTPFPSGGSLLLLALKNADSPDFERVKKQINGITKNAGRSPFFFAFWLLALA